jgi:hypothetical protein
VTKREKPVPAKPGLGWPQAFRDVVTAAINKGQLPALFAGAIILVFIWRLPENELAQLAHRMVDGLKEGWMLGYVLFILAISGWAFYSYRSRMLIHRLTDQLPAHLERLEAGKGGGTK